MHLCSKNIPLINLHETTVIFKINFFITLLVIQLPPSEINFKNWNNFVSNETVLTRSNVVDIETLVAQNRLRWLGYLCRMSDSRTIKLILYCELAEGSRSVGRPKLRYKDNLKTILKNGNILETWSNSVHDRSEWRSLIKICFECNRFLAN